jgi:hypothetical protein
MEERRSRASAESDGSKAAPRTPRRHREALILAGRPHAAASAGSWQGSEKLNVVVSPGTLSAHI